MATKYIDLIAEGIRQFDTRNYNNSEITMDHYRALAWEGLRGTNAWSSFTQEQKNKIDKDAEEILSWHSVFNCNHPTRTGRCFVSALTKTVD